MLVLQCLLALTRSNAVGGKFHGLFKKVTILFVENCVDLAGQVDVVGDPEMEKPSNISSTSRDDRSPDPRRVPRRSPQVSCATAGRPGLLQRSHGTP